MSDNANSSTSAPCPQDSPPNSKPPSSQRGYAWLPIPVGMICSHVIFGLPPVYPIVLIEFVHAVCPGGAFVGRIPNCYGVYYDLYNIITIAFGGLVGVFFSAWTKRNAFLLLLALILFYAAFCCLGKAIF